MRKLFLFLTLIFSTIVYSQSDKFTIVIDAGHGGNDKGAESSQINEAEFILDFSKVFLLSHG